MFYSTIIFLIAFLPLFTMQGVEGAIFSPMSRTYAFALVIAILLAVMLSPVLSSFFLHKGMRETHNIIWEAFHNFYHNLFVKILRWPRVTLAVIVAIVIAGLSLFPRLGGEFLPKLEEGNIWAHAIMPTTTSLSHGRHARQPDARSVPFVSRSFECGLATRKTRRRYRDDQFFHHRIFGRTEARLAMAPRHDQAAPRRADR